MSRQARAAGPRLPSPAELRRATARTAAAIADPASTAVDVYRAAEAEEATVLAFMQGRGSQMQADLEHWREAEAG
jgi:hypothetical protein